MKILRNKIFGEVSDNDNVSALRTVASLGGIAAGTALGHYIGGKNGLSTVNDKIKKGEFKELNILGKREKAYRKLLDRTESLAERDKLANKWISTKGKIQELEKAYRKVYKQEGKRTGALIGAGLALAGVYGYDKYRHHKKEKNRKENVSTEEQNI